MSILHLIESKILSTAQDSEIIVVINMFVSEDSEFIFRTIVQL